MDEFESVAGELGYKPQPFMPIQQDQRNQQEDPFVSMASELGYSGVQPATKSIKPKDLISQDPGYTEWELRHPALAAGKRTITDIPRSIASGFYGAVENIVVTPALAGVPGAESAMDFLDYMREWVRPKAKGDQYALEAIESGAESIGTAYATGRALGGKGKVQTVGRGIFGKGVTFGEKQYYQFMNQATDALRDAGMSEDEIKVARNEIRPFALMSGAAEVAGEIGSDLLTAKVFGLLGGNKVSKPVKDTLKNFLIKKLGVTEIGELSGEELTTVSQYFANKYANEVAKKYGKKGDLLPQEDLLKQLKHTGIVTALQAAMTGGVAHVISDKEVKQVNKAKPIVENVVNKKKAEKATVVAQKGPKTRNKGRIQEVSEDVVKASIDALNAEIALDEYKEATTDEVNEQIDNMVVTKSEEAENARDVRSVTEELLEEGKEQKAGTEVSGENIQRSEEEGLQGNETETTPQITSELKNSILSDKDKVAKTAEIGKRMLTLYTEKYGIEETKKIPFDINKRRTLEDTASALAEGDINNPIIDKAVELGIPVPNEYLPKSADEGKPLVSMTEIASEAKPTKRRERAIKNRKEAAIGEVVKGLFAIEKTGLEAAIEEALSETESKTSESSVKKLTPAIRTKEGKIYKGKPGEVHGTIASRLVEDEKVEGWDSFGDTDEEVNVFVDEEGNVYNRKEAAKFVNEKVLVQGTVHAAELLASEKPKSKRKAIIEKRKEKKEEIKREKKAVKKVKPTADQVEAITEGIYDTPEAAALALENLEDDADNYVVRGNKDIGYMIVNKDDLDNKVTESIIQADQLFQTLEQVEAIPRDTSNVLNATKTMLADINRFYHTASGDIVNIGKQLSSMIDYVSENPRELLKEQFRGDVISYNKWVDQLHQMASYVAKVQEVRGAGQTLDFMGFQQIHNELVAAYNRWRAKRAFHNMKTIQERVDDEFISITNNIPDDINWASSWLHSGSLPTTKHFPQEARDIADRIIEAELWFKYNTEKESELIDRLKDKLTDEQIKEVTELGFKIEKFSKVMRKKLSMNPEYTAKDIDETVKAHIADYIDNYSDRKVADTYKDIRQVFDAWRERYKEHLINEERASMNSLHVSIIDEFIKGGKPLTTIINDAGLKTAKEKRAFMNSFSRYFKALNDISTWGDEDYITHMMVGNIRVTETFKVVDDNGKVKTKTEVIAVGRNIKDAIEKAKEYAKARFAENRSVGKIALDDEFIYDGETATLLSRRQYRAFKGKLNAAIRKAMSDIENGTDLARSVTNAAGQVVGVRPAKVFAPPTIESKNILPGENDVFVAMHAYSRVMWKKVSYDPVINEMKRVLESFEKNVREHLEAMLKRSKGEYSSIDKFFDSVLEKAGIETTRAFTKGVVNPITKLVVNAKLGYRPIAALLNAVDGFAKVSIQFRQEYVAKAIKWANTDEGKEIIEKNGWALGQRFEDVGGHLKTQQRLFGKELTGWKTILTPTGLFNAPELPIRQHNFATAFIYYKEQKLNELKQQGKYAGDINKINEEAVDFAERCARISVWRLQGSNTMAERSRILASPVGRMFGVFMPYFVRNVEFITANAKSIGFWAKWLPYTLGMSGPRGLLAMLRSVPFLELIFAWAGAGYIWEKIDKALIEKMPYFAGGVASLADIDIVGPATAQFPTNSSTAGTLWDIYSGILEPVVKRDPNMRYKTADGFKNVVIFARNWSDILNSHFDEDGWVLDEAGRPKYNLNTAWDKAIVGLGAAPQSRTLQRITNRMINKREQQEIERAQSIVKKFRNEMQGYFRKEANLDVVSDRVVESALSAMLEYHVSPKTLRSAVKDMRTSPGVREIDKAKLLDKLDVFEAQIGVEQVYPGTVF